jgi:hypothetical protein
MKTKEISAEQGRNYKHPDAKNLPRWTKSELVGEVRGLWKYGAQLQRRTEALESEIRAAKAEANVEHENAIRVCEAADEERTQEAARAVRRPAQGPEE